MDFKNTGLYNLTNGKLTSKFYILFMIEFEFELIRDWLYLDKTYINSENSYNNPNMVTLRKLIKPIKDK